MLELEEGELLSSWWITFPGRSAVRGDCAGFLGGCTVLGKGGTWLTVCLQELAVTLVVLVAWKASQVIFPSFLHNRMFNLFTCLLLALLNLSSLTFSTKAWHFLKLEVDKIDASFDLHRSLCLAMLSRILLMDLILVCRSCFSAVLIIFLVLSVLKVVFNLILTGTNSLWMHLRVKILWFCSHSP